MEILISVIILGGLGLIFGCLLLLASIVFYVKEDNRLEEVLKMLPGANCGGCGKPGCSGFAQAIMDGEIKKLSLCKPGKADKNFQPIIDYLKNNPNEDGSVIEVTI